MLKLFFSLITLVGISAVGLAQTGTWQIDPAHSSAQFAVRHLGVSTVRGAFTKVNGSATYDSTDPSKTTLNATIEASSVDTRVEMRDKDLRSPNFFDVEKYPTITFVSKQAKAAGEGRLQIVGDLTIHGVTKEVTLDVDGPSAPMKDPMGNQRIGASATTKVNRRDFGVNGAPGIAGDDVSITIDAELIQKAK